MKSTKFVSMALACTFALVVGAVAFAETSKDAKTTTPPTGDAATQAMMAEWAKNATPGKEHATLKTMEGKWKATVKTWMGGPEPQVSVGTCDNEMEFGGRVLEGTFKGEMMGSKFNGLSLMGFDNKKREYWSFWTDDMSTGGMMTTGTASADGKTITMKGMMDGMDGKPTEHVLTTKIVDANTHTFTIAQNMGGKMTTMMEITYTRSGSSQSAAGTDK